MKSLLTKACGKVVIAGEYAVLFGSPALVTSAQANALCTFTPGRFTSFHGLMGKKQANHALLKIVVNRCKDAGLTVPRGDYVVDTSAFFHAELGQKIGLGSSAAATVALTKMVLRQNGILDKTKLLQLSLASHHEFSKGLTSGVDVAASVFGKTIEFTRTESSPTITQIRPSDFLRDLIVVSLPRAQNTRDFVEKVVTLKGPSRSFLVDFTKASRRHCLSLKRARTTSAFITAMDQLSSWLESLSTHAQLPIMSNEHRAIYRLAKSLGGSAKPSGAGGGDISIAYVPSLQREYFTAEAVKITGCRIIP